MSAPSTVVDAADWRPLGRYALGPKLAQGGMAELYIARSSGPHGFEKYVVIKRILDKWADDREFVEMFLDEARLAAQLDHPNVAQVHDIGQDQDGPFFAMEYIHGETLLAVIQACRASGTTIPLPALVAIGSAAAAGLHHAHERRGFDGKPLGIIHRDVSPSNIIASYEGALKLVDFGIAKAATSRHSTRPSIRKGKMAYMSPEQCRGDPLDRRADLFALGVVLYELATLTPAFSGEGEYAVMNAIVNHDIEPPSARCDGIPAGLEAIVMRLLRRDRQERYADGQQVQRDLDAFAAGAGLAATTAAIAELMVARMGSRSFPWERRSDADAAPSRQRPAASVGTQDTAATVARSISAPAEAPVRRRMGLAWPVGLVATLAVGWLVFDRDLDGGAAPKRGAPATDATAPPRDDPDPVTRPAAPMPEPESELAVGPGAAGEVDLGAQQPGAVPRLPPAPAPAPATKRTRSSRSRPADPKVEPVAPAASKPGPFDPDAPAPRPR